jgi:hypothetical protein
MQNLRGEVKFKCLLCRSKTLYKERSMKKHRSDKICKKGRALFEKILSGAQLDPPPSAQSH